MARIYWIGFAVVMAAILFIGIALVTRESTPPKTEAATAPAAIAVAATGPVDREIKVAAVSIDGESDLDGIFKKFGPPTMRTNSITPKGTQLDTIVYEKPGVILVFAPTAMRGNEAVGPWRLLSCLDAKDGTTELTGEEASKKFAAPPLPRPAPPEEVTDVNAAVLQSNYESNELSADKSYKGNLLRVTGIVDKVGRDSTRSLYVYLRIRELDFHRVQCFFDESYADQLEPLRKGARVRIAGRCLGLIGGDVVLTKCSF